MATYKGGRAPGARPQVGRTVDELRRRSEELRRRYEELERRIKDLERQGGNTDKPQGESAGWDPYDVWRTRVLLARCLHGLNCSPTLNSSR